jgi:integral membrane sensor domain MASE1
MIGSLIGCIVGATIGTLSLFYSNNISVEATPYTWITWLGGDMAGALIFAPLLIYVQFFKNNFHFKILRFIEFLIYALLTLLFNQAIFYNYLPEGLYWGNCLILFIDLLYF